MKADGEVDHLIFEKFYWRFNFHKSNIVMCPEHNIFLRFSLEAIGTMGKSSKYLLFNFFFLGLQVQPKEDPRLGVE